MRYTYSLVDLPETILLIFNAWSKRPRNKTSSSWFIQPQQYLELCREMKHFLILKISICLNLVEGWDKEKPDCKIKYEVILIEFKSLYSDNMSVRWTQPKRRCAARAWVRAMRSCVSQTRPASSRTWTAGARQWPPASTAGRSRSVMWPVIMSSSAEWPKTTNSSFQTEVMSDQRSGTILKTDLFF